jgi:hypothetical protein
MGNPPAPRPGITRLPGTDDTEAVMNLLFGWHHARKVTTGRLHS